MFGLFGIVRTETAAARRTGRQTGMCRQGVWSWLKRRHSEYDSLMDFDVRIETTSDGEYVATCSDPEVTARGLSRTSALELMRAEIRYRLEMCPCSSVDDDYVQLRVER